MLDGCHLLKKPEYCGKVKVLEAVEVSGDSFVKRAKKTLILNQYNKEDLSGCGSNRFTIEN